MKEQFYKELDNFFSLVSNINERKEYIIKEYGSIENYYKSILKSQIAFSFPIINKYFELKKHYLPKYKDSIDDFYIDFFNASRDMLVERYGNLVNGIIKYNNDLIDENINIENEEYTNLILDTLYDCGEICIEDCCICLRGADFIDKINSLKLENIYYDPQKLEFDDILMYARKVIERIDPNLVEEFDSYIKSDFVKTYNKKNIRVKCGLITSRFYYTNKGKYDKSFITLVKKESGFDDIVTLIHEFMHYINYKNISGQSVTELVRKGYTEFISIYFERYAKKILHEEFNIPIEYFDNKFRINSNISNAKYYKKFYLPYLAYESYHEVNYENVNKICKELNKIYPSFHESIDKLSYDFIINRFVRFNKYLLPSIKKYNYYKKMNKEKEIDLFKNQIIYKYDSYSTDKRNHFFGTLLAYKENDVLTPKDVLRFSNLMNKDNKEFSESDIFKKIFKDQTDIFFDNDTFAEIMNKMIDEHKMIAKESNNKRGSL